MVRRAIRVLVAPTFGDMSRYHDDDLLEAAAGQLLTGLDIKAPKEERLATPLAR